MAEELERKPVAELIDEIMFETVDNFSIQKTGSDERRSEAENVVKLADAYTKIRQIQIEEKDRDERRRIEEEKNAVNYELEKSKEIPFWQSCIEWTVKYILPGCISGLLFDKFQKRTLEFEETGSFRSKASKDLRSGWSFWK